MRAEDMGVVHCKVTVVASFGIMNAFWFGGQRFFWNPHLLSQDTSVDFDLKVKLILRESRIMKGMKK